MKRSHHVLLAVLLGCLLPTNASAQINFEKSGYYLSLGDSVAAGEGALPVTHGFVYELYDRGAFGKKQVIDFSNIAIKGATADEVLALQLPEALCIQPPRIGVAPSVITLTAGANDFFVYIATSGVPPDPIHDIPPIAAAIADKVADIVALLVFGPPSGPAWPPYCALNGIPGITVLVSNYYSFEHPDPAINFVLDLALQTFSARLQERIGGIQAAIVQTGRTARVGFVDTFSAMAGRSGLLLIERRNGFTGGFDFEIHPTNAGHAVIAREFEEVWNMIKR